MPANANMKDAVGVSGREREDSFFWIKLRLITLFCFPVPQRILFEVLAHEKHGTTSLST